MYSISVKNKIKYHKLCFIGKWKGAKCASPWKTGKLLTNASLVGEASNNTVCNRENTPHTADLVPRRSHPHVTCSHHLHRLCGRQAGGAARSQRPSQVRSLWQQVGKWS